MKFAFLVHPLGRETDRVLGYMREVDLQRSFGWKMPDFFHDLHMAMTRSTDVGDDDGANGGRRQARVIDELPGLVSALGASADGRFIEIPMDSFAILDDPRRAYEHMIEAVKLASDWGASIVGLGSLTGVIGGQGTSLAEVAPVAITTGNSLTVFAAVTNLRRACADLDIDLAQEDVVVVGVPGSIATAAARWLRPHCRSLILVGRQKSPRLMAIAEELDASAVAGLSDALGRARVVFSATSSGGCIDQDALAPGTIVSDVGVPTDVLGSRRTRDDVLILSGGICMIPDTMPRTSRYLWLNRGSLTACIAETIVLALDERCECFSIGRHLELSNIEDIGRRAQAHGFDFSQLFSFGQRIDASSLAAFRKFRAREHFLKRRVVGTFKSGRDRTAPATAAELGKRALERFGRHMNPVLAALGNTVMPTFVKGQGNTVWDTEGRRYLDFIAGYGSLNLGHNPPQIVAALHAALADEAPGFSPAAINPYAAALAEQLVALAPGGLDMVTFGNSGAEAVEAALKLARRTTGRRGLLSADRSYHGKTLGALSVTGNAHYQRPFEPLVPECDTVPFGDLPALERALTTRRYAAFIVEPIQAEGGINVPQPSYLPQAAEVCKRTDTLLIVDEIQTGLGRTGTLFAVDKVGVEPDMMTVAKSLGGGLVPIGALLSRRELWLKAYGTLDTCTLHTSTFAGGSLACAAGLATLKALRDTDVIMNAARRGRQLMDGLKGLEARSDIVGEVRGQGLLIGIEFMEPPQSLLGPWRDLLENGVGQYLVPGLTDIGRSLTSTWVMTLLAREYGIYTQVARSNPRVLRVEPALILSAEEAALFLDAIEKCVREVETAFGTFDQLIAKAVIGRHGDEEDTTTRGTSTANRRPEESHPTSYH